MPANYSGFIPKPTATHGSPTVSQPSPAQLAVIPDDVVKLPDGVRALYIGSTGNVTVDDVAGNVAVLFANVPTGQILPIQVTKVQATGTSASQIVALY